MHEVAVGSAVGRGDVHVRIGYGGGVSDLGSSIDMPAPNVTPNCLPVTRPRASNSLRSSSNDPGHT